jgi:hypothetical protein
MFILSEAEAAAIRTAYEQGGELAAAAELRRLFPGLANNENTRICARTIAGWKPLPEQGGAWASQALQPFVRRHVRSSGCARVGRPANPVRRRPDHAADQSWCQHQGKLAYDFRQTVW